MSNPETERERERAGEREIFSHSLTRPLTHSHWIALLIALATFALYLRTLAPDVVDADGGEFQFAAWNFGFVHPTGYPLFLILGGLFQHLVPIGNPAYRLSVFNALIAAGAIGILFLAINELTRARGAALIAAFAFALTRAFWYDANAPEVYALNALFIALLFYLAARWQTNPHAKTFAAFCFILGLALTHHRAILLWLPGFGLFFLLSARQQPITNHQLPIPNYVLRFTFYFLLPLLLYLYLPSARPPRRTRRSRSRRDATWFCSTTRPAESWTIFWDARFKASCVGTRKVWRASTRFRNCCSINLASSASHSARAVFSRRSGAPIGRAPR